MIRLAGSCGTLSLITVERLAVFAADAAFHRTWHLPCFGREIL